jgi:hypothetical protein
MRTTERNLFGFAAKSKRVTAFLVSLVYSQSLYLSVFAQEEPVKLVQTEPSAAPAILRDDSFLDPRETEYISKWLKAGQYMPLSELKPGMQGYGLTVFQGNKIERFDVTVIGVVKKVLSGRDAVMVRLSGPLMGKNTVIRGMSGSPVYINGKLVGAVSYGFDFSREPIVGLTPITDMLDALTPDKRVDDGSSGRGHIGYRTLPSMGAESGIFQGTSGTSVDTAAGLNGGITTTSGGGTRMIPLIAPISLSGFSSGAQEYLGEHFKNFGMSVSAGTAGAIDETLDSDESSDSSIEKRSAGGKVLSGDKVGSGDKNSSGDKGTSSDTIKPGGAVSVLLVTGDFSASATGTATTTFGGNVLAFGHPFMQAGPVDFPMATAYIHQVLPNLAVSFKVASPVKIVGSVTNDRPWAIGGELGRQSKMIPATYTVTDRTRGVKKTFHLNVINHADLTPELLASTAMSAIDTTHQSTSPYVVTVDSKVTTDKVGVIERHDKFAGNFAVHGPVDSSFKMKGGGDSTGVSFLSVLTRIVNNDFEKAQIKGVNLNIVLDDGHDTARLERISLDKQKVEPGETVKVTAVLRPYNKPRVTRELALKLPRDIPDGNLLLGVGPGDQIDQLRKRMGVVDPQPENLNQVANRIREQGQGNVLEAVLALPEQSLFLDGRRIVSPPANWLKLFFSDRYTKGPQIVKGEVRAKASEPWLLDGMHLLALTVERKEKAMAHSPFYTVNPTNSHSSQDGIYMTDQARKVLDAGQSRKSDSSSSSSSSSSASSLASSIASAISGSSSSSSSSEKRDSSSSATSFSAAKQYPHMRSALAWRQATEEDFRNGKAEEVSIDSRGRLSPGFHEAARCTVAPEMQIWSAACTNGTVYFSAHNRIYSWKEGASGPESVASLDCSFCPAIAVDSKGSVFAAAAPGDRVLSIKPNGSKHDVLFKTGGDTVTTLCVDDRDNVYAGVAADGKVWFYDAVKKSASVIFDSGQAHITSLWFSKSDKRVYVGTAEKGAVYSIDSTGNARAEYQTNDHIVTGAVKDSKGNLYITTSGSGHFYKVKPSGETETLATSEGFYSVIYDPASDTVFAGDAEGDITQAKQEEITGRAYFLPVAHTQEEAVSALALDGRGHLFAATSNFPRVLKFDLAPSAKATYNSQIRDAQRPANWSKLLAYGGLSSLDPQLLSRLAVDTRTGNSSQPDASWSSWSAAESTNEGFTIKSPRGRYLQYRLKWKPLDGKAVTIRKGYEPNTVRRVDVTYLPTNAQPYMSSISVNAGAHLSGKQDVSITGNDPDHDNMLLSLELSSDDGKTWKTLAADLRSKKDSSKDSKDSKNPKDSKDQKDSKDPKISNDSKDRSEVKGEIRDKDKEQEKSKDKADDANESDGKSDDKPVGDGEDKSSEKTKSSSKSKSNSSSNQSSKLSEEREPQAKAPPVKGPQAKDPQGKETPDKDAQGKEGQNKEPQAKEPQGKDPQTKDSQNKEANKDSAKDATKDSAQSKDASKDKTKTKANAKESPEATLAKALSAIKSATQSDSESATEQFTYNWDTTKQKDGNYVLRVKLDDRLSNPRGYMENERWGTITVDNTPPQISDVKVESKEKGVYQLILTAEDKLSLITNATYKMDDGSPFAMMRIGADGTQEAADSQTARLSAEITDVKSGEHKFVIEVTDQAGNTETKTVTLTLK